MAPGGGWEGRILLDLRLPFGLRSAPKIFNAVADALQWIFGAKGIAPVLHYLDDFILVEGSMAEAEHKKAELVSTCRTLGIPLEPSKLEGPSSCLTFLGIEVDTQALQLRLPVEKLDRLKEVLDTVGGKRSLTLLELQSLVGLLQHASKVVRPGRSFMRRLHALLSLRGGTPRAQNHFIRLNGAARADILWWSTFIREWNGVSMMWAINCQAPEIQVVSDASGSWGCGAHWLPHWFYFEWTPCLKSKSIQVQELFPVVVAAGIFGRLWKGKTVQFIVDNKSVVDILNSGYSKEAHLMHMIRVLVFLASHFQFWFMAAHIEGVKNTWANAISRNKMDLFLLQASPTPDPPSAVPPALADLLSQIITWTSTSWTRLFRDIIWQL